MTTEQTKFIAEVKAMCMKNYSLGGDTIIECYTDEEIIEEFKTLDDVKEFCGLKLEQATNTRWGEDSDPEIKAMEEFKNWE